MSQEDLNMNDGIAEESLSGENRSDPVGSAQDSSEDSETGESNDTSTESGDTVVEDEVATKTVHKPINKTTLLLSATCLILAALLVLTQLGVIGTIRKSEAGSKWFSTPEDAVRYFVEKISVCDLNAASAGFVTPESTPKSNFKLQILNAGSYDPLKQFNLPEQYSQYAPALQSLGEGQAANTLIRYIASLLLSDRTSEESPLSADPTAAEQEVSSIITALDPAQLKGLSLVRTDILKPEYQNDESFITSMQPRLEAYGMDAYTEYAALIRLNDKTFITFFAMASVNGKWKIIGIYSDLIDFSYPMAIPITEEEYVNVIG